MKKDTLPVAMKVCGWDILILAAYLFLACGLNNLVDLFPQWLSVMLIFILWLGLIIFLFFSHSKIFLWISNDYLWSLSTGISAVIIAIPIIIYSVHNPCFFGS